MNVLIEFFKVCSFSWGGGLATLPNIYEMARRTGWCTELEITNMISLSQMTPGPMVCNVAAFVGNRLCGFWGSMLAVIGAVLPSIICMTIMVKVIKYIENSENFKTILSMIRATGFSAIIYGSSIVIKNSIFNNPEILNIGNCLQLLSIKAIVVLVVLFFIRKKFKLNLIKIMGIGAVLGIVLKI